MGYAELTPEGKRFNAALIVGRDGRILSKYRKVHLPGTVEPRPGSGPQQLEKRYFTYGDLGFSAFKAPDDLGRGIIGMMICNDRRWPEAMVGKAGSAEDRPGLRDYQADELGPYPCSDGEAARYVERPENWDKRFSPDLAIHRAADERMNLCTQRLFLNRHAMKSHAGEACVQIE